MTTRTEGERPLADSLADFWRSPSTLRPAAADEGATAPALAGLGPSGVTVGGRDLAELLAPAYRRMTEGG